MLRFVLGRSGTGKTQYLNKLFTDFAKSGSEKLLMIVPDQSSFETVPVWFGRKFMHS